MSYTKEQSNNIHEAENDVELSEIYMLQRKRDTKGMKKNNEGERQNNVIDKVVTRKEYREWTEDLHARFMQVVHQLGEGRCFPKEIVEVMSLPGLTRMQVASHLQETNTNANSQQYVGEPIMSGPRNIVVASHENYVVGSNYNEKENSDAYLNFNNMDYLFQNLGPSGANLPNEQGNEFDQVYSDNQNLGPPSANLPNEHDSEFDQVYSDDQVSASI
uniref:OJ1695_H09.29 gene product (ISS) n=1 Tax=Solanum tuberosum TaxID=4113 RepID=M1DFT1_SOLTU